MNENILLIILPAIITIISNYIFYIFIKSKIDKSIEKKVIAYSGVFKEKLNIYRKLLKKIYKIKIDLNRFQYSGNKENVTSLMKKINDFIQFYLINQPFLSDEMLNNLGKIREEFQEIFEKFYKYNSNNTSDNLTEFFEASNKLKSDNPFAEIEKKIISEMRKDLKTAEFRK